MSKYQIDFVSKYPCPFEREAAAIKEIQDYLGEDGWKKLKDTMMPANRIYDLRDQDKYDKFHNDIIMGLGMFQGIEGYPARLFATKICDEHRRMCVEAGLRS